MSEPIVLETIKLYASLHVVILPGCKYDSSGPLRLLRLDDSNNRLGLDVRLKYFERFPACTVQ